MLKGVKRKELLPQVDLRYAYICFVVFIIYRPSFYTVLQIAMIKLNLHFEYSGTTELKLRIDMPKHIFLRMTCGV